MTPKKPAPAGTRFKSLDEILETDDLKYEDVYVEEWDTMVRIGVMPGSDRDEWEQKMVAQRDQKDYRNIRSSLVALTMLDSTGKRMATTPEQIAKLGTKSSKVLDVLFTVAQRMNKLTEKDIKELEGN
jgi:hypothetical protein